MIDPSFSNCVEGFTAITVAIASALMGKVARQLHQLDYRVERIEEHLGMDTSFYRKKKKKAKK